MRAPSHLTAAPRIIWDHLTVPVRVAPISFWGAGPHSQNSHAHLCSYIHTYIQRHTHMYTRSFYGRGERCLANFTVCLHPHIHNDCDKAWRPGEYPTPPRRQALTQPPRHNQRASQKPAPPLAQDSARHELAPRPHLDPCRYARAKSHVE